ncbi:MAG: hypothetical protein JW912_07645, partial [Sedimentisphaerales bacterium]|nr:hypothetical protein [Sedimentisphaerales bacterium]
LNKLQAEDVRPPFFTGELAYDSQTAQPLEFAADSKGRLSLWVNVDASGRVPSDMECVLGIDIASGTGASNSCITVGNKRTKEKVAELASANIPPHTLAKVAVALARWFNGAHMIWEANGPGTIFGPCVLELGYRNIYYRKNDKSISAKVSDTPGWYATKDSKLALLGEYRKALGTGKFINRSYHSLKECRQYIFTANGSVEHSRSINTIDPTGAKDNHGDRVIADALCWKGLKEFRYTSKSKERLHDNCLFTRRQEYLSKRESKRYW